MTLAKQSMVIVVLVIALISCARPASIPELTIELSDLTLCKGWNATGEPITFLDTVSSDETRLCICGHLETNREKGGMLQIKWSRDGSRLLRNPQVFDNGLFLSCIEEAEGFESGNYVVTVTAEKREIGRVEFTVGEDQREE